MIAAEVKKESLFGHVVAVVTEQAQAGLRSMAEAVIDTAYESMPVHGRTPADPDYSAAPAGQPPYSHTESLREALAYAVDGDRFLVGTLRSKVGVRGAVLEFGGRPGTPEQMAKRRKRYKHHPFIGPALDKNLDTFAPRVAGTLVS